VSGTEAGVKAGRKLSDSIRKARDFVFMSENYNVLGFGMTGTPDNWASIMNHTVLIDRIYYVLREGAGYIYKGEKHYFLKNHIYVIDHTLDITWFLEDANFYHAYIDYTGAYCGEYEEVLEIKPEENTVLKADTDAFIHYLQEQELCDSWQFANLPNRGNWSKKVKRIQMMLEAFLCDIEEVFPKKKIRDLRIAESINYIRKEYSAGLTVEELAGRACLSKNQYSKIFFQETGMSPHRYITSYRMEIAVSMLRAGRLVKEVAFGCGFLSEAAFSNAFRKQYGYSPREFMKKSCDDTEKDFCTNMSKKPER